MLGPERDNEPMDLPRTNSMPGAGMRHVAIRAGAALVSALLVGALIAALSPGDFLPGWLAASLLLAVGFYALLSAWEWASTQADRRTLAILMVLTFALRLGLGLFLNKALPVWGYA